MATLSFFPQIDLGYFWLTVAIVGGIVAAVIIAFVAERYLFPVRRD